MKTIVPFKISFAWTTVLLLAIVLITGSGFRHERHAANLGKATVKPSDTILVQKQLSSKKHKIKLYPNANHQVLFFSAAGEEGKVFQLFLFDIDGKLIKQVNILNSQVTVLNRIDKGNYTFDVFSDDQRIESGHLIVK